MKILFAVHHLPPVAAGGAGLRAYRTGKQLEERGHQIRAICVDRIDHPDNGVSWEDSTDIGINVRRLSFNLKNSPDPVRYEYDNPWIGEHVEALCDQFNPDIFHLFSGYLMTGRALSTAQKFGLKTIVSLTDFWFVCPRITMLRSNGEISRFPINTANCVKCLGEQKRRYLWLGKIVPNLMTAYWGTKRERKQQLDTRLEFLIATLSKTDVIISPSRFLRDAFINLGIDQNKIIFSRQGQDFSSRTPDMLVKAPSNTLRLGYMGQIVPHKGIHILLDAMLLLSKELPISLKIYGDQTKFPEYTNKLKAMTKNDPRVKFYEPYEREGISDVLQEIDLVVVPSIWYENSPNIILEAYAHQTPVITSNLGGMSELVQHGITGFLFEPGNAVDLAHQLEQIAKNKNLYQTLHSNIGPVRSTSDEIDELEAIYQKVRG